MSDQPETVETGRSGFSRRGLLGGALVAGALVGAATGPAAAAPVRPRARTMLDVPFEPVDVVRIGLIGLGNRGSGMVAGWVDVPGAQVVAVCDIRAERATARRRPGRGRRPAAPGRVRRQRSNSYAQMLRQNELDLVYVATPWEFHYAHGKAALEAGAHAMVELPIATELDELWSLVDTARRPASTCGWLGELQLRPQRARDAEDGARGRLRRDHRRPRRLPARPARAAVRRRLLHRRLAPALAHPQHRELLPHARPGADRGGDGRQPRRPRHHPDRHRDGPARAGRLPRAVRPARPPLVGARSTSTATSSPAC